MENKTFVNDLIHNPEFRNWVFNRTPENESAFENFLEQHSDRIESIEIARKILLALDGSVTDIGHSRKEAIWEGIKKDAGIAQRPKVLPINSGLSHQSSFLSRWWLYAAVALFVLSTVFYLTYFERQERIMASTADVITKTSGAGQKSKIFLPDGSVVYLNSKSELHYDENFGKTHRTLSLSGEAFFEVTRNEKVPFVVESDNVFTKALGTSFNVNSNSKESIAVILVTGKVQVGETDSNTSVILNKSEKVCFDKVSGFSDVKKIKNLNDILWKDGILVFDNMPVTEVLNTLENWYNVEIQYKGEIGHLTFSGTFDNEYLSNVLKSMAYSLDFKYELDGKNVKLKF